MSGLLITVSTVSVGSSLQFGGALSQAGGAVAGDVITIRGVLQALKTIAKGILDAVG